MLKPQFNVPKTKRSPVRKLVLPKIRTSPNSPKASSKSSPREEVSIENYNPGIPVHFTESYTIQSINNLGLTEKDLFYPTPLDLSKYPDDRESQQIARDHLIARVHSLIADVKYQRRRLIAKTLRYNGPRTYKFKNAEVDRKIVNDSILRDLACKSETCILPIARHQSPSPARSALAMRRELKRPVKRRSSDNQESRK